MANLAAHRIILKLLQLSNTESYNGWSSRSLRQARLSLDGAIISFRDVQSRLISLLRIGGGEATRMFSKMLQRDTDSD